MLTHNIIQETGSPAIKVRNVSKTYVGGNITDTACIHPGKMCTG